MSESSKDIVSIAPEAEPRRKSRVGFWAVARAVLKHRMAFAGTTIIVVFCLVAIFAPWIAPMDPYEQDLYQVLAKPSKAHWLGTDNVGRDLFSRIVYGSRVSMATALFATLFSTIIGVVLGLIAGFKGGVWDMIIMRTTDTFLCIPWLVFVMLMSAALGPGFLNIIIAISALGWTGFARIVRGQVLLVRELPYVESARASGASEMRIMFKHLMPNSIAPIIVAVSMTMGGAIGLEAAAAFLGLGVQAPTASWGRALRTGFSYMERVPLFTIAPGLMITLAILAFNFLGDGLRDALDPRLRGEGKKQ